MEKLSPIKNLILVLASGGVSGGDLRKNILAEHPACTDGEMFSALLSLQDGQRLKAEDKGGVWIYTAIDPEEAEIPEVSPEFAEMLTAADCGEWHEIDVDVLLAELDEMIRKAKAG